MAPLQGATRRCSRARLAALRIAACLIGASFSGGALAAELTPIDSPFCHLLLNGDIADGDADAFKAAVERTAKALHERLQLRAQAETYNLKMGSPAAPNSLEAEVKQKLYRPMQIEATTYERYQRSRVRRAGAAGGDQHRACLPQQPGRQLCGGADGSSST